MGENIGQGIGLILLGIRDYRRALVNAVFNLSHRVIIIIIDCLVGLGVSVSGY